MGPVKFLKYDGQVQREVGWGRQSENENKTIKEPDKEKLLFGKLFFFLVGGVVKQRTCCSLQHDIHTGLVCA